MIGMTFEITAIALFELTFFVNKIPYRRAPRLACRLHVQLLGRVRRASKGILHINFFQLRPCSIFSSSKMPYRSLVDDTLEIFVRFTLGCALFSKFLGLNAVLVELDELRSGVPTFLKSDHGKLLRIAILCLVTWVSRGTCVMVS